MILDFEPGDKVVNPKQKDWGIGQVQSIIKGKVTFNFENEVNSNLEISADGNWEIIIKPIASSTNFDAFGHDISCILSRTDIHTQKRNLLKTLRTSGVKTQKTDRGRFGRIYPLFGGIGGKAFPCKNQ